MKRPSADQGERRLGALQGVAREARGREGASEGDLRAGEAEDGGAGGEEGGEGCRRGEGGVINHSTRFGSIRFGFSERL
eukprot:11338-Pelagococcus_subviridis.AAC.1